MYRIPPTIAPAVQPRTSTQESPSEPAGARSPSVSQRVEAFEALGRGPMARTSQGPAAPRMRIALPRSPETSASTQPKPEFTALDRLMSSYDGRNLSMFFVAGGVLNAAKALESAKHVMLLTGFSVAANMPETDGPPGTAALGHALRELGKIVTYVTDPGNAAIMKAAVGALDSKAAQYGRLLTFDASHDGSAVGKANELLDKYKPDAVVAIELPSRAADGSRHNMRGVNIDPFNGPVDEILVQANKRERVTTVGVGDGGNEAGMGGLPGIPKALDGSEMAAKVPAQHPATSWNSNLGGEAIGAVMLARAGKLDKLHTPEQQAGVITATLAAGAVDGVTRKKIAGELSDDGKTTSGVDGFSIQVHGAMLEMLKNIAGGEIPRGILARQTPDKAEPFLIGAFDSSNGGLVAAKNLAGFLEQRSNHGARFAIVVDHGNAPYGVKTRDQLITLVGNGLKTAQAVGVDVIAMACNTACTSFPESMQGLKTPVLDLIDVTAKTIANLGGNKPAMFSTPATAKDPMYPNKVRDASSDGKMSLTAIGAHEWAPLINDLKHHESASAEEKQFTAEVVKKYVEKVPLDASSVWLCCTHYPALKPHIEAAMKETGRGHIPVIDPMEHQAEAIIAHLDNHGDQINRSRRLADLTPLVLTTGTERENNVKMSADKLLGRDDSHIVYTRFDKKFDMALLSMQLFKPASSPEGDASGNQQTPTSPNSLRADATSSSAAH